MANKFYDFKNLKGDLSGGLVAGVIALPLALAFGVQSGLGATAGLYGAIILGILAALLGGTATQASGPTGPMTVVSAAVVTLAVSKFGGIESALPIILLTFFLGGIFQILFGILRAGSYIKYFPYPVISGFMTGVGLIIILFQLFPFFGLNSPKSTIAVLQNLPDIFTGGNLAAIGIGLLTILVYYLFPKITKAVPSTLVALILATFVAYILKIDVPLIGDIPSGLPELKVAGFFSIPAEAYALIIEYAIVLAALGSIDSLLTSVIADNITKTRHQSNRELIGQGIGNAVAAMFGGLPGAGATKGTVININSGGKTRLSGAIHGFFLLIILLGAGSLAAYIPIPVLAGILIPVGLNIIDYKALKHLLKVPRSDTFVLLLVLLITTFGNLIYAVGIGIVLASVLFMKKVGDLAEERTEIKSLGETQPETLWADERTLYAEYKNSVYIKHLYGPLFFGFASEFQSMADKRDENMKALIIRMDRVPYIDQSGLYALENVLFDLKNKNIPVILVGLQDQPKDKLQAIGIIPNLVQEDAICPDIETVPKVLKNVLNLYKK
ncbi:MAG: SulP family inorganic anion transporter [Gelidibacter sp.]|nr:SulP family inorganic anion transporter [Gelidibacter sp.]